MMEWLREFGMHEVLTADRIFGVLRAVVLLLVGWLVARLVSRAAERAVAKRMGAQESMLLRRLTFYTLFGLVTAAALHQLGFRLGVLLGAAGVLTVAVGFASQTSASNLISGLFLVAERPFVVGDMVRFEDVTGEVLSIDLLSVKLRTMDNLYVRIPNEAIIKTKIVNLTFFPIRRVETKIGVAYADDLAKVRATLLEVAAQHPLALDDPEPLVLFDGFSGSSIDFTLAIWTRRENFFQVRSTLPGQLTAAFRQAGLNFAFPQLVVHSDGETAANPFGPPPPRA